MAPYPSKILPLHPPEFSQWIEAGLDIVRIFLDETKKRSLEAFFSHRINGGDDDFYADPEGQEIIPLKQQHPEWTMPMPWGANVWNFLHEGVRDYSLSILEEVARNYDFDGIELDFARGMYNLPAGEQWLHRDVMTRYMRQLRLLLLDIERERSRPLLLAARVPENLPGCHFEGLDVQTWQTSAWWTFSCRDAARWMWTSRPSGASAATRRSSSIPATTITTPRTATAPRC